MVNNRIKVWFSVVKKIRRGPKEFGELHKYSFSRIMVAGLMLPLFVVCGMVVGIYLGSKEPFLLLTTVFAGCLAGLLLGTLLIIKFSGKLLGWCRTNRGGAVDS
ncbi:MAG: hypothetical protein DRO11_02095 [Methanobacteriota archaeon]|nr:MAG: hypothetical protein DRO11_02095 [Euryarchaeota archaeon]